MSINPRVSLANLKTNQTLNYTQDKTGLITSKNNTNYTYDNIGRLTQAGSDSFSYDAAGNNLNNSAIYNRPYFFWTFRNILVVLVDKFYC